jgi:predicted phage terminase large subunit-like protein
MTEEKTHQPPGGYKPSANPNNVSAQRLKEVIANPTKDIDLFYALSKAKLLFWARLVDPTFKWPKHIRYIAERLERVHSRGGQRLIIEVPPRHGKSTLSTKIFPAWYIGNNPSKRVITASSTTNLATSFSRYTRNIFREFAPKVFGEEIAPDSKGSARWDLKGRSGGMLAAGVGKQISGFGADVLLIDDATRNAEEAYSQTSRDKVWTWYVNDARTRLHSGGSIVIIGTRWHEDDIIGRALDDSDEKWERIRLPALSEGEGDLLGRPEGKALWPSMFDLDYFRAPMKETNVWHALYQQNPIPIGGGIIKRDWVRYYDCLPEDSTSYLQSWDMTFKKTSKGSYVVGQVWCRDKANFYLVDQVRKRCNFADTLESVKTMIGKWPKCNRILVEDKANGPAIISMLKQDIPGVIAVKADASKEARLRSVEPYFEAGNVFFPEPGKFDWVDELVAEVTSFPGCKYDDQVDAMSQALSKYRDDYATMPSDADMSFGRRESPWRM